MALHFELTEFQSRLRAAQTGMAARGLDGMLLFAPESHYYLSGYDTFGFALFQCMALPAEGNLHLLTRAPDLRQAQQTSILNDAQIHIWRDGADADPHAQLAELLAQMGLLGHGKRLGIETDTAGLTAFHGRRVEAALAGRAELVEASDLVRALRRRKSSAEIACHRRAAELSDDALDAALHITRAGAFEGGILAAMQGAIFAGGGDYPGNEFIIGSGPGALLCRYFSGRRHLDARDQLTLEWSGAYRHYHAAMMRTLVVGAANDKQKRMHAAAVEALLACEEAVRPGAPMGDVFDAHARVFDAHGFSHARLNACGYGMGATYTPCWMEQPMFHRDNPLPMETDQVFFLHMILMDSDAGLAMCVGHSVRVTDTGVERLSRHGLDLVER
ncbi:MAG: Xaa-Pro peptidase family protein [Gammaproteobacteria bacterium]|nr:Xaa-Pro peptidase family protein [Gammaproteobacteria bacterium]